MIKISVVTVTYNAEKVLPATLDSVFAQDYPAIEHIIVDGVSADDTVAVAREYVERSVASDNGHDTKIIVENDNGIYDAMNKGLAAVTGDYVVFLNAGDAFKAADSVRCVAELARKAAGGDENRLPAVVYGETDIVDGDRRFVAHRRLKAPAELSWRSFRNGMLVCHQSFFARTDIAKGLKYDLHYRFSADFDWCVRVMKEAELRQLPLVFAGRPLVDYLSEGTTTRNHKRSLHERFDIMVKYYGRASTCLRHVWFAFRSVVGIG